MDGQRFDNLVRRLGGATSRRSVIKSLAAGAFASVTGLRAVAEAEAEPNNGVGQGCKRASKNCKTDVQCCAGLICPGAGACTSGCRIGSSVYTPGQTNPANVCQLCDPARSTTAWSNGPAGVTCNDGNACTSPDQCDGNGLCVGTPLAPAISCPGNLEVSAAAGACGAVAHFSASATCGGAVTCSHADGATFPVGSTTVTCTATNGAGSTSCAFTVHVSDDEDPSISCPPSIGVAVNGTDSAVVNFAVTAADNCGAVNLVCDPPSGSVFYVDTNTTVTCTATDGSGHQQTCSFPVTVGCEPSCGGKACGEDDGCGQGCFGTCPSGGPCADVYCDPQAGCQSVPKPGGTGCGDLCHPFDFCDGNGNCNQGQEITCPPFSDPCWSPSGTCNPATGECEYDVLVGQRCDAPFDDCRPGHCQADGSCLVTEVQCASPCQTCSRGQCIAINEHEVCNDARTRICIDGACASPCGNCPDEFCLIETDGGGFERYLCCPESARLPVGFCCWVRGEPGVIIGGQCYDPAFICEGGVICATECCGRDSARSGTGSCCPTGDYCITAGVCKTPGQVCSNDAECVAAGWGGGAVCAGMNADDDGAPIPGSGTCCPVQNRRFDPSAPISEPWGCCPPGEDYLVDEEVCCGFPNPYDTGSCVACGQCSFSQIRRCC